MQTNTPARDRTDAPPTPREPKPTAMLPPVIVCELQFTEVPALLFGLSAMTSLNLSSNFIEELPSELGNLDVLTHLDLSRNRLSELPDQVSADQYHNFHKCAELCRRSDTPRLSGPRALSFYLRRRTTDGWLHCAH